MDTPEGARAFQAHLMVGANMIKARHQVVGATARLRPLFVWQGVVRYGVMPRVARLYNLITCNSVTLECLQVMVMMKEMGGFVWFFSLTREIVMELLKWQEALRQTVIRQVAGEHRIPLEATNKCVLPAFSTFCHVLVTRS